MAERVVMAGLKLGDKMIVTDTGMKLEVVGMEPDGSRTFKRLPEIRKSN